MQGTSVDMIHKLKRMALQRCEERVLQATEARSRTPPFSDLYLSQRGVTSALRHHHGL